MPTEYESLLVTLRIIAYDAENNSTELIKYNVITVFKNMPPDETNALIRVKPTHGDERLQIFEIFISEEDNEYKSTFRDDKEFSLDYKFFWAQNREPDNDAYDFVWNQINSQSTILKQRINYFVFPDDFYGGKIYIALKVEAFDFIQQMAKV